MVWSVGEPKTDVCDCVHSCVCSYFRGTEGGWEVYCVCVCVCVRRGQGGVVLVLYVCLSGPPSRGMAQAVSMRCVWRSGPSKWRTRLVFIHKSSPCTRTTITCTQQKLGHLSMARPATQTSSASVDKDRASCPRPNPQGAGMNNSKGAGTWLRHGKAGGVGGMVESSKALSQVRRGCVWCAASALLACGLNQKEVEGEEWWEARVVNGGHGGWKSIQSDSAGHRPRRIRAWVVYLV